jgi:hypothetical protein
MTGNALILNKNSEVFLAYYESPINLYLVPDSQLI